MLHRICKAFQADFYTSSTKQKKLSNIKKNYAYSVSMFYNCIDSYQNWRTVNLCTVKLPPKARY